MSVDTMTLPDGTEVESLDEFPRAGTDVHPRTHPPGDRFGDAGAADRRRGARRRRARP